MSQPHSFEVKVGAPAPSFTLEGPMGTVSLSDYLGKHHLLIYFVREFGCHSCMAHALTLAKLQAELSITNTRTIMIGGGPVEAAKKVRERYRLPYHVLADPKRAVYSRFGFDKAMLVIQKSGTVLIDKGGVIRYIHSGANPGASLDKVELLQAASRLAQTPA